MLDDSAQREGLMKVMGSCHCGLLHYTAELPFEGDSIPVRRCGCTFCRKHGAVWTSHPAGRLDAVVGGEKADEPYRFATGTAWFYVCPTCGAVPFVTSDSGDGLRAVLNVNTLDDVDPERFNEAPADFDGEATPDRLTRRGRTWIGAVTVDTGPRRHGPQ